MKIVEILLALVRYSFLCFLLVFIYFVYKMMVQDLTLLKKSYSKAGQIRSYFQLYILDPGESENLHADTVLPLKEVSFIGRDASNDIVINDPHISSKHARLEIDEEDIFIIDLGSTNGTFVNGRRIKGKQKILLGEEITIGDVSFEVVGWENESSSSE